MKRILIALIVTGMFFSCKPPATNTVAVKAPIDSLMANYNTAWKNHDSLAVRNLFASDALLIDDALVATNLDEISAKWIGPFIKAVSNATSSKLQDWSNGDRAGFTGTWSIDVKMKDSVMNVKGTCTIIWLKDDKGEWKITTANLHSTPPPNK